MLKLLVVVCSAVAAYSANAKTLEINTGLLSEEIMLSEPSQDGAYKLARSHFLPDYQAALTGRTSQSNGGGNTKTCASYGNYFSECPSGTVGVGKTQPAPGVTCYKACDCDMNIFKYNYSNCMSPKLMGERKCEKLTSKETGGKATVTTVSTWVDYTKVPNGFTYYSACGCGSDFTLSSCPNGALCQECDGKYKQTGCKSGYTKQVNGTCCLNGYANIPSCPNTAPTRECPTSECCRCLCLNNDASCTASNYPYSTPPTCARSADSCSTGCGSNLVTRYKVTKWTAGYSTDGKCTVTPCPTGYSVDKTSCATGYKLETNGYSAGKPCGKCVQKSCSEGGYVESCAEGYKPTGPVSYGGKTCYTGCTPKTCSEGGYKDSCGTGYTANPVTYGGRTCYNCTQKPCSDGGYKDSCGEGYKEGTSVTYGGKTCYNCIQRPCSDGGYKDSCGEGKGTAVTYGGKTCYKDCPTVTCPTGYTSSKPSDRPYCLTKEVSGVTCYACSKCDWTKGKYDMIKPATYSDRDSGYRATHNFLSTTGGQYQKVKDVPAQSTAGGYLYYIEYRYQNEGSIFRKNNGSSDSGMNANWEIELNFARCFFNGVTYGEDNKEVQSSAFSKKGYAHCYGVDENRLQLDNFNALCSKSYKKDSNGCSYVETQTTNNTLNDMINFDCTVLGGY